MSKIKKLNMWAMTMRVARSKAMRKIGPKHTILKIEQRYKTISRTRYREFTVTYRRKMVKRRGRYVVP